MPATCPAILLHSNEAIYTFGLVAEWAHLWLHEITDSATRERQTIADENLGISIYEGYKLLSASYAVDCHTRAARGIANYHPGWQITPDVLGALFDDLPFHLSKNSGVFVFSQPRRQRPAGDFHHVNFQIDHLFPEGDVLTASRPGDPDHDGSPIVLNPDPSPGDQGDGSGSNFEFQVVRLFYDFVPARGSGGSPRSGYVTRLIPSSAAPSLGSIYLYGNPPALSWSSPGPIGSSAAAPDWSANDQTATPAVAVPGIYTLTKVYDLTNNAWLLHTADANKYDSATHGTDVIVSRRTTGAVSLKIGNFPDLASVVAVHAGTTAADFEYVWNAVTGEYYRLVVAAPSTDPAAFWRITRPQSPAGRIVQAYHIIGHRANTTAYNLVLASYDNFISPGGAAGSALDYLPATPPKEHFYSADTTSAAVDHTTVYSVNDTVDDIGNGTTDRLGRTVGGPDLWCWKWAPHVAGYLGGVAVANSWDWVTGNAQTLAAWGALTGNSTANLGNYAVLVHLTSPTGPRYYKGSPVDGDPLALTTGIVQY